MINSIVILSGSINSPPGHQSSPETLCEAKSDDLTGAVQKNSVNSSESSEIHPFSKPGKINPCKKTQESFVRLMMQVFENHPTSLLHLYVETCCIFMQRLFALLKAADYSVDQFRIISFTGINVAASVEHCTPKETTFSIQVHCIGSEPIKSQEYMYLP